MKLRARLALSFAGAVAAALLFFCLTAMAVLVHGELGEKNGGDGSEDVEQVLSAMLFAAPVAIGGAAVLGLWLARRSLAPLREASLRAKAARASELDLTLPVGVHGDEWDHLAQTLNTLLFEARGSVGRIRTFTADAAHELRTPLTTMIGEIDVVLRRERSAEELRAALVAVREDGERLARVVEALLTLARADARSLVSRTAPAELERLAREAADQALASSRDPRARVEVHGGATVQCEPVLLLRAIQNLVDNGLRHGGGQVTVRISTAGAMGRVLVQDEGPGIDPQLAPQLFDRFRRGDAARVGEGLGLGLSLSRALVEAQGGTVRALPAARGAEFELCVPLAGAPGLAAPPHS